VILKKSPLVPIIFLICFHFNRLENGKCNSSSEGRLRNPKTNRGSFLDLIPVMWIRNMDLDPDPGGQKLKKF
jgi:hypothetical protein